MSTFKNKSELIEEIESLKKQVRDFERIEDERKRAEKALQESEEKYRTIFDESPIGIELYKADGMQITANKASLKMFGIPDKFEIHGFNVFDGTSLDDEKKEKLRRGEPVNYQSTFDFEKVKELQQYKTNRIGKAYFDFIITPLLDVESQTIQGYLLQVQDITQHKQAEEAIQESEIKYRSIFESFQDIYYRTDNKGIITEISPSVFQISGYEPNELIGKPVTDVYEDPVERVNLLRALKESGKVTDYELKLLTKDKKVRTGSLNSHVIVERDGEISSVEGVLRDITERKQVEEKLQKSEEKYRALFDNMLDGFAFHETVLNKNNVPVDYTFIEVNDAFENQTGLKREKIIGKKVTEVLPGIENDPTGWIELYGKVSLTLKDIRFESFAETLNKWYSIYVYSPKKGYFATIFEDITKRKQVEIALANQGQRLADILEGTNAGTWEWNVQTGEVTFNKRWAEIIGYTLDELEPIDINTWINNVHPDDLPIANALLDKHFIREVDYYDVEFRQPHKDGRWVWVNARGKVIEWTEEGKPLRMSGTHLDIRKSRNQLRSLAERLQMIREEERASIAREIHDDLGQTLTALKMDISWMKKNPGMTEEIRTEKINTMLGLTDSTIQTVKRIATELRPGILDDLGLIPAIEWETEEFRKRTGIKCNLEISVGEITIEDNISIAVFRIFQESLTNIARHSGATKVDLAIKSKGNLIQMEITDNGVGITEEQMRSPKSLGLMGMNERVSFFGGKLAISKSEKGGTTVMVYIPIVKAK